jgi:hypothetical protein
MHNRISRSRSRSPGSGPRSRFPIWQIFEFVWKHFFLATIAHSFVISCIVNTFWKCDDVNHRSPHLSVCLFINSCVILSVHNLLYGGSVIQQPLATHLPCLLNLLFFTLLPLLMTCSYSCCVIILPSCCMCCILRSGVLLWTWIQIQIWSARSLPFRRSVFSFPLTGLKNHWSSHKPLVCCQALIFVLRKSAQDHVLVVVFRRVFCHWLFTALSVLWCVC